MEKPLQNYNQRTEIVQDIIERMPQKFGLYVTGIVLILISLLFFFGFIIQYPDTVTGGITINAKFAPVKLVANASGKIILNNFKTKDEVKENDYIAIIQNTANINDIYKLKALLEHFNLDKSSYSKVFPLFPTKISLGEINAKYYAFLNALNKVYDYEEGNVYLKQEAGIKKQISELTDLQANNRKLKVIRENNMILYKRMADRDSVLLSEKVATAAEFDNSNATFLTSKENYQSITNDINNTDQRISDDHNKLEQLYVKKDDDESQMQLDLLTAFDDLKDQINAWELRYVFKAPISGQVEFLKFWNTNEFVQAGEDVFTILPKKNKIIGQVQLPAQGAGKVKVGQEVIIKLDNYPFQEYGSVKGKVLSISSITNRLKMSNQTEVDAYLVDVELPDDLKTNYGGKLDFKYEIKGTADIISNKRNLLERFFDNLRYSSNKN
jgi:multidrug efflux pump subunit AcrA (membrane-fusion protein)